MRRYDRVPALAAAAIGYAVLMSPSLARADGNLNNVNHFIFMMQENHSFDNYLGALPYVPGTPYHGARGRRGCPATDNTCVDGLSCKVLPSGDFKCRNGNTGNLGHRVHAFHDPRYCTGPDLDHSWIGSHMEGNFRRPNNMLKSSRNQGFVRVNAASDPPAQVTDHDTMGFYTDVDLPFYYDIAKTFAISDRFFAAVIGQTFPNRAYFAAGTSFGHLTTSEIITPGGYKPINGTIYSRLDAAGITWTDYFSDLPYAQVFSISPGHTKPASSFATDAAAGMLPQVSFVDPSALETQTINGRTYQTDEHPPNDIRAGEYFVAGIIAALRSSPNWNDSVLFLTYDEHGGFYDHVKPPAADQGGASTPDGIAPGQCADASNPPASEQPGGGKNCNHSKTIDAPGLCPNFNPIGPYPANCATFNQLGFRLPLIAVSPFAKPHYVSHVVGSHTSFLAMLEKRYSLPPLGARDTLADTLEDLFDFDTSPSASGAVGTAPLPRAADADPNCPFNGSPSGAFVDDPRG